jgi:hypothetical protein
MSVKHEGAPLSNIDRAARQEGAGHVRNLLEAVKDGAEGAPGFALRLGITPQHGDLGTNEIGLEPRQGYSLGRGSIGERPRAVEVATGDEERCQPAGRHRGDERHVGADVQGLSRDRLCPVQVAGSLLELSQDPQGVGHLLAHSESAEPVEGGIDVFATSSSRAG